VTVPFGTAAVGHYMQVIHQTVRRKQCPTTSKPSTSSTSTFTTLEIRIIEHLVAASIADRSRRRQKMLKRPSSRKRESDAEFEMALEPLQQCATRSLVAQCAASHITHLQSAARRDTIVTLTTRWRSNAQTANSGLTQQCRSGSTRSATARVRSAFARRGPATVWQTETGSFPPVACHSIEPNANGLSPIS
jgi:hypothetical protein